MLVLLAALVLASYDPDVIHEASVIVQEAECAHLETVHSYNCARSIRWPVVDVHSSVCVQLMQLPNLIKGLQNHFHLHCHMEPLLLLRLP